jgi:hypothetical protein
MKDMFRKIGIIKKTGDGKIKFVTREEAREHLRKSAERPAVHKGAELTSVETEPLKKRGHECRLSDCLEDQLWINNVAG